VDWILQWWREVLAVAGAFASLVGLPVAIHQIDRSRKAANEAKDASNKAKDASDKARDAISRNLTAIDLERASSKIQDVRDLHRRRRWEVALSQYHDLRRMLSDILARYPDLAPEQRKTIQQAILNCRPLIAVLPSSNKTMENRGSRAATSNIY
jgi:hypothetical protein